MRQVALVEPPDFSYGLVIQGGDITFLPGLESWLNSFIKNAVLNPYILPDGVTIPLAPGCGCEVRVIVLCLGIHRMRGCCWSCYAWSLGSMAPSRMPRYSLPLDGVTICPAPM